MIISKHSGSIGPLSQGETALKAIFSREEFKCHLFSTLTASENTIDLQKKKEISLNTMMLENKYTNNLAPIIVNAILQMKMKNLSSPGCAAED